MLDIFLILSFPLALGLRHEESGIKQDLRM